MQGNRRLTATVLRKRQQWTSVRKGIKAELEPRILKEGEKQCLPTFPSEALLSID